MRGGIQLLWRPGDYLQSAYHPLRVIDIEAAVLLILSSWATRTDRSVFSSFEAACYTKENSVTRCFFQQAEGVRNDDLSL